MERTDGGKVYEDDPIEKIGDGGSAFPDCETIKRFDYRGELLSREERAGPTGMSRRDYFAAAALPALISRCMGNLDKIEYTAEMMAKSAYEHADAMLKQSAQTEKGESK